MKRITPIILTLIVLTAQGASAEADWPQFRGPNRDGISHESGLLQQWPQGGPKLAFQVSGIGGGYSSVSVQNGRVFTMGDIGPDQFVIGLSLDKKRIEWKTRIGPAWTEDGYAGPRGTPTADGELIYAIGTEGDLMALEAATGKVRWKKSLPDDFGGNVMSSWKWAESPLVDGDRLVVTPGAANALMVSLDKATGREVWRTKSGALGPAGRDGAGYSSIVISNGAGVKQYVQMMGRGVVSVRAADGKFLWTYNKVANETANISSPLVMGDYVFAATGYQKGSALVKLARAGDGVFATEQYFLDGKTFQNHHGGMVLVGGHVYAGQGHRMGLPICVELATGRKVWGGDIRNAGKGSAAVAYADSHLIFRYENGLVMLIEATPAGYKEKGQFEIPNGSPLNWPHPAIADGKLFLRDQDRLLVYDIKASGSTKTAEAERR
ncbi:MAG: PQQ-like beta-propeller repeat protein [Vicinamibacteria bacterium]|nr:PQQ-like beta-propeller repeat protein [Vicinamibacteria bacterium]